MFNFFKSKKATINSLSIPDFGWEQVKNDSSIQQWVIFIEIKLWYTMEV